MSSTFGGCKLYVQFNLLQFLHMLVVFLSGVFVLLMVVVVFSCDNIGRMILVARLFLRGYRCGSPTAVRPGNPALCGSHPIVTPYYCRLGDLLCFVFIVCLLYFFC